MPYDALVATLQMLSAETHLQASPDNETILLECALKWNSTIEQTMLINCSKPPSNTYTNYAIEGRCIFLPILRTSWSGHMISQGADFSGVERAPTTNGVSGGDLTHGLIMGHPLLTVLCLP